MRFPDMNLHGSARAASLLALALLAGGCSVMESGSGTGGSTMGNLLKYGSTTEPPIRQQGDIEAADCPTVGVLDGRAAIRQGSSQISISNIARECTERPDGTILVKVGIEGLALLGSGGGAGRFNVPVVFQIRQGDKVTVSRVRQAAVAMPAGDSQGTFMVVEGGMAVSPRSGPFDIEVGLGGGSGRAARRR